MDIQRRLYLDSGGFVFAMFESMVLHIITHSNYLHTVDKGCIKVGFLSKSMGT